MVREHAEAQGYALLGPVEVGLERADDLGTGMFRVVSSTTPGVTAQPQPRPLHEPIAADPVIHPSLRPATAPPLPPVQQVPFPQPATAAEALAADPVVPSDDAGAQVIRRLIGPVNPRLVVHGTAYPLSKPVVTIGRGADVDIRIDDPGVSRHHATFHLGDPCSVVDLASTNGTWMHEQRISESPLADGDELRVGSTTLLFRVG